MSGKQLMVSQRLPWWGTLAAREQMARHEAGALAATYDDRLKIIAALIAGASVCRYLEGAGLPSRIEPQLEFDEAA